MSAFRHKIALLILSRGVCQVYFCRQSLGLFFGGWKCQVESSANTGDVPGGTTRNPTAGPPALLCCTEQSSCSPGAVPGFMVLHGTCGTGHRPAEACTKAPLETHEVLATGPSREAKQSSSSQALPGPCSQQTSASLEAAGQAGISCSVLKASGAQEQETQQQIAREARLCASWLGYRHGAAGDASQHALSASSTHAKCHD